MTTCEQIIDLSRPLRSERRRGFQPPWYTVYVYRCERCGAERYVRAGAFRGSRAEPGIGGITCGAPLGNSPTTKGR